MAPSAAISADKTKPAVIGAQTPRRVPNTQELV